MIWQYNPIMDLATSLAQLNGVGPEYAKRLERLELHTITDLLYHFPFRYEDYSKISTISEITPGEKVTIQADVWQIKNQYTKFRKIITKAIVNDSTGSLELTWFHQPYLSKSIKTGDTVQVSGVADSFKGRPSMTMPDWEKVGNHQLIHTGRLVPIYPETAQVTSKWFRNHLFKILPSIKTTFDDFLPPMIKGNMLSLSEAITQIHFPNNWEEIRQARLRLGFDELFLIQLTTQRLKHLWNQKVVIKPWYIADHDLHEFIKNLPFELTQAQLRVLADLSTDLQKNIPMNRLVQGEVGSGKTVVAAAILYLAYKNGFQSLLMAPTEILAWQHFNTVKKLLEPVGVTVGIYTGSSKYQVESSMKKKTPTTNYVLQSTPDIIVGTHALLSEKLKVDNVGLVIIDEQHRFGVEQRALLRQKGTAPHMLTMTATPIPRTVALTLYGDLDLSTIDQLPKNRPTIHTHLVPEHKRNNAYTFIADKIRSGDQAYIITPLIEESEVLDTKAATTEYEKLKKVFSSFSVGLLHGKMKPKEKDAVLEDFRTGKTQLLVSTSVVEVGVDVPNATIMVIEGSEKFGLAQLHQLRGRIGRGTKESYCLLFTSGEDHQQSSRLKYMEKTFNGLELAELDLKIRGTGTIFGTAQHGRFDLKIADLNNLELIERAQNAAANILQSDPTLDKYPILQAKLHGITGNVMPD